MLEKAAAEGSPFCTKSARGVTGHPATRVRAKAWTNALAALKEFGLTPARVVPSMSCNKSARTTRCRDSSRLDISVRSTEATRRATTVMPCERCVFGNLVAYCTRRIGKSGLATRHLKCDYCGATAKEIIPVREKRVPMLVRKGFDEAGGAASNTGDEITNP